MFYLKSSGIIYKTFLKQHVEVLNLVLPAMKAERKGFGRAGGVNEGYLLTKDMRVVKLLLAKVRIFLYSSTNTGKLKFSTENSEHT